MYYVGGRICCSFVEQGLQCMYTVRLNPFVLSTILEIYILYYIEVFRSMKSLNIMFVICLRPIKPYTIGKGVEFPFRSAYPNYQKNQRIININDMHSS